MRKTRPGGSTRGEDARGQRALLSARDESTVITELELVLAEKRTALSVLRTGLAVTALPMTVVSFLIVTSRSYDPGSVLHLIAPLLLACLGLFALGITMVGRALLRLRHHDRVLREIKEQLPGIGHLLD